MNEAAHRQLMTLYGLTGQQALALRQYQECVRLLDQELDVPPDEATTALHAAIREKRLRPLTPAAPPRPAPTVAASPPTLATSSLATAAVHRPEQAPVASRSGVTTSAKGTKKTPSGNLGFSVVGGTRGSKS